MNQENAVLRCSFCNKDHNEIRALIAGPTVFPRWTSKTGN
jgi:hypothetical protein